jgi:Cdc6-like AAA superfamily ATPase
MLRINFQPYTTPQLETIVRARLELAARGMPQETNGAGAQEGEPKVRTVTNPRDVIAPDGIKFACMKVSSISGDARRVLDVCRYVALVTLFLSVYTPQLALNVDVLSSSCTQNSARHGRTT